MYKLDNTSSQCIPPQQCNATIHSITQHHAASRSITQHHAASRSITQHHAASRSITQHHAASRSITQHHAASRSITQHHAASSQYITYKWYRRRMISSESSDWCIIDQEAFINNQYQDYNITCKPGQFSLSAPHISTITKANTTSTTTSNSPIPLASPSLSPSISNLPSTTLSNNYTNQSNLPSQEDTILATSPTSIPLKTSIQANDIHSSPTNNETIKSKKRKRNKKGNNQKAPAIDEEHVALISKDHESFLRSPLFLSHFLHFTSSSTLPPNLNDETLDLDDGGDGSKDVDLIQWGETMKVMQHFSNTDNEVS